jgi:hypothetical protein
VHPGEGTRRHGSQRADDVTAVEHVEDRNAVGAAHYGLTVEREGLGAQQRRGNGDRRVAAAPVVAAPGEKTNLVADAAHLQSQSGPAGGFTARVGMQGGMYPSERNGMCQNIGLPREHGYYDLNWLTDCLCSATVSARGCRPYCQNRPPGTRHARPLSAVRLAEIMRRIVA